MRSGRNGNLVTAIGAGIAVGAGALVTYEAVCSMIVGRPARRGEGSPDPIVHALSSAPPLHAEAPSSAPPSTREPHDRFADDPTISAACPPDMTLVEGDFCPALAYRCARPAEDHGFGCAEYERGQRCLEPTDPRRFCIDRHEWPNRIGEPPTVFVDWHDARSLCAGAGKRLCRRSEWTLACEGPKRLPYPWGFVRAPSPCNVDRAAIPPDVPALLRPSTRDEELARLWQADPIGSHPDCISSFGAYDLSGNVDEWTDNLADDPGTSTPSTLNGGYWGPVRNTCRLTTTAHGPDFRFYQVGFRCCAEPIDGVVTPPPRPWVDRKRRQVRDG
ncbi:formylglycine-generating enzyme family protein [Chondromyces crocatus]|uniref:Sulfatase-modifying factor enzyme-like domain-containing protein n=1 Tax=Chondromyces crocatus TaxID=52 RepID=A0A0K1EJ25_CHOCO|nr:SUMF1/EgtB/PvdO family nonheme iron enzyme [Chondromyces crocatus]AKT40870.1 uncharacterized protein CMC5_050270 [Chondromyces crocatus]